MRVGGGSIPTGTRPRLVEWHAFDSWWSVNRSQRRARSACVPSALTTQRVPASGRCAREPRAFVAGILVA